MATDRGYICLHRSIQAHWVWQDAGYLYAWVDMLMMAQWEDKEKTRLVNGKRIATSRGQFVASLRFMSSRWGWTLSRTRTFIGLLEGDTMIAREIAQGETVVSILKYDEYNTGDRTAPAQQIAQEPHSKSHSARTANRTGAAQGETDVFILKHDDRKAPDRTDDRTPSRTADRTEIAQIEETKNIEPPVVPQGTSASESSKKPKARDRHSIPPTIDEVAAYCEERQNSINPQKFIDSYSATGWMRGKTKIKDWQACVRTWEANNFESDRKQSTTPTQDPTRLLLPGGKTPQVRGPSLFETDQ